MRVGTLAGEYYIPDLDRSAVLQGEMQAQIADWYMDIFGRLASFQQVAHILPAEKKFTGVVECCIRYVGNWPP